MRKKALLVVLLAIVLATAGVAYAAWTSTLYVDAVVKTGFANMQWSSLYAENNGGGYGTCVVGYADDYHTFTLTVDNAYPGFTCKTWSEHKNTGTVPLKVQSIDKQVWLNGNGWAPGAALQNITGHTCGQEILPGATWTTVNTFTIPSDGSVPENATIDYHEQIQFVASAAYASGSCP
jgi:hypothetical protein